MKFEDHDNYNCQINLDNGQSFKVYANWIHNNGLDHWQGWHCEAGHSRLYIDKNLQVYSGECKNDYLGSALEDFEILQHAVCKKPTCTGCTDDLMVEKHEP